MKIKLILISILTALILNACGGGNDVTIDGSSEDTMAASMEAMFPDINVSDEDGFTTEVMMKMPPAIETIACESMKVMFSDFSRPQEESMAIIRNTFNGMNKADIEAYGKDNDLIGCMAEKKKGIDELESMIE